MKLAIAGAGELGKLVAHHAINNSGFDVVGYYDDFVTDAAFNKFPVLGKIDTAIVDFENRKFDKLFIAIGYSKMKARQAYYNKLKNIIPLANIIHTSAYMDPSCKIGEGVFILPGCTLDFGVEIEDNVLLNTGVTIAHHTKVGNNSFIAPGVKLAGLITINENCFIGVGATLKDSLTIGANSVIGAGAVVINDTTANSISFGVPAKEMKTYGNKS
jgi:sugar O-acyltransferase (sialic acid O-acetyltransferase NeuD family)